MHLAQFALTVRDYDEAIAFFCRKLDFVLLEDTDLGSEKRWVRIQPPNPPSASSPAILLARAATKEQLASVGSQTGGRVFIFLHTDNIARDFDLYSSRGVTFLSQPRQEPYGKVAVFLDLYGNKWDLIQPASTPPPSPTPCRVSFRTPNSAFRTWPFSALALRTLLPMPLTPTDARSFATRWFAAWNSHNIESMMACYDPAIEHSSPFIKRYNDAIGKGDEPSIKGIPELRAYFQRALDRNPTLRFDPVDVATGLESVILTYRRHSHDTPPGGDLSAEIFFLVPHAATSEVSHRIIRSVSHYG